MEKNQTLLSTNPLAMDEISLSPNHKEKNNIMPLKPLEPLERYGAEQFCKAHNLEYTKIINPYINSSNNLNSNDLSKLIVEEGTFYYLNPDLSIYNFSNTKLVGKWNIEKEQIEFIN
jgi:hypothetical protein